MEIVLGLLIIAIGSFCQSSSYVPIKKVRDWSWESFWLVQGVFAWLVFPFLGALLAVPAGHSLCELFTSENSFRIWMTILFGALWGVGGLTFGLSMRYLGVALGQSISLGTCAGSPALSTAWPDLDSYRMAEYWRDLSAVEDRIQAGEEPPVIILSAAVAAYLSDDGEAINWFGVDMEAMAADEKLQILSEMMWEYGYAECFGNARYVVYLAQE